MKKKQPTQDNLHSPTQRSWSWEVGAWHLGYFRAEIPPGSHSDISLVFPDVAALVPMGMVAALTRHTSQHRARAPRDECGGAGSR